MRAALWLDSIKEIAWKAGIDGRIILKCILKELRWGGGGGRGGGGVN